MEISFLDVVNLFKAVLGGIVTIAALSPLAIWITKRVGLLDIPGSASHKQHPRPTPLAGGIAIVSSIIVLILIALPLDRDLLDKEIFPLLAAAGIVFLFGLWDDAKGLGPLVKAAGQILAAVILIAADVHVHFLEGLSIPFLNAAQLAWLDWGITIFWLVGITNAFNLVDSMDGLAIGIAGIAFAFFMIMTGVAHQPSLAVFSACMMGMCIGLYAYNISPALLFLGDSGAQTLGFILAAIAMIYTPQGLPQGTSWFVPVIVLGVPIFDTTLVVVSRLLGHRPVFKPDRIHTYHRLVALGLDPNRAVLILHMASFVLCLVAFIALSLAPSEATLLFGLCLVAGMAVLVLLCRKIP